MRLIQCCQWCNRAYINQYKLRLFVQAHGDVCCTAYIVYTIIMRTTPYVRADKSHCCLSILVLCCLRCACILALERFCGRIHLVMLVAVTTSLVIAVAVSFFCSSALVNALNIRQVENIPSTYNKMSAHSRIPARAYIIHFLSIHTNRCSESK